MKRNDLHLATSIALSASLLLLSCGGDAIERAQLDLTNCQGSVLAEQGVELIYPLNLSHQGPVYRVEWTVNPIGRVPAGGYHIDQDGVLHFTPSVIDENLDFTFGITATEMHGAIGECNLTVSVAHMDRFYPGDINGDGFMEVEDITEYTMRIPFFATGDFGLTESEMPCLDANRDGIFPTLADFNFLVAAVFEGQGLEHLTPVHDTTVLHVEAGRVSIDDVSRLSAFRLILEVGADHNIYLESDCCCRLYPPHRGLVGVQCFDIDSSVVAGQILSFEGEAQIVFCGATIWPGNLVPIGVVTDDSTWTVQYPFDFERWAE